MNISVSPQQTDFLRILAKTGFLTNKHLKQIGFGHPNNSKHYLTKNLLNAGYIGRIMLASPHGIGRKVMYFLARKGAEFLAELDGVPLDEIAYSSIKGGIKTTKDGGEVALVRADFFHKESYICAFLAFEKYLQDTDYSLVDCRHYYQLTGDKKTDLPLNGRNFRPDGIFFTQSIDPNAPHFVYVVEIHRHSNRKHIVKQLRQQVEAIKQKSMQKRFGIDHPYFVMSIFTSENLPAMAGIIEELKQYPEWVYIEKFFIFAKLDDIIEDLYKGFGYFGGIKKPLPPKII